MITPAPVALHHTCFLVRDLEGAAQRMADAFGIGPWHVWTIAPPESKIHGRPGSFSFRLALATVGGGTFELISPLTGPSVFDEHLDKHGEGFHHTCMIYDSIDAVRAAKAELQRQGREIIQEGRGGDAFEFAYFNFPEIGSIVEVLYLDATQLPAPEAVIRPSA